MLRINQNDLTRRVEVITDSDVSLGALTRSADMIGIPVDHALSGATVTFIEEGIVALTYSGQGTIGTGSYLYWDVSAGALSNGAAVGDVEVGQVLESNPQGLGATVKLVRMNIGFPRAAAAGHQSTEAE